MRVMKKGRGRPQGSPRPPPHRPRPYEWGKTRTVKKDGDAHKGPLVPTHEGG